MKKLVEKAPAKINLALDVRYKRPDGYHEVEMIMTMVDLVDRIYIEETSDSSIRVTSQDRFVPNGSKNLAYQAALLLKNTYGITKGVQIQIEKTIPVAAGLAGGSSDAAATLRGLNRLWNLNLQDKELAAIGEKIGSDVPFCIRGGTALATGRGEILTKLSPIPSCWVVLAKPEIGISTADVYRNLKLNEICHPDVKGMIAAIQKGNYEGVCSRLGNVLESVTEKKCPEIIHLKERMLQFGADAVLMSGSGPTVFALVQHDSRLNRLYNGLKGFCHTVYAVRSIGQCINQ